jgi:hypothetical protein
LIPSIVSPMIYVILVYFIAGLRTDDLAANLFIVIASVSCFAFSHDAWCLSMRSINQPSAPTG